MKMNPLDLKHQGLYNLSGKELLQNCHISCGMQATYSDMEKQVSCALIINEHQLAMATKGKQFNSWDNALGEPFVLADCCA